MQGFCVRPLALADVEICIAIEAASYPPAVCEGEALFRRHICHCASYSLVVLDNCPSLVIGGKVIGYALCSPIRFADAPIALSKSDHPSTSEADTLYLHDFAVMPTYRGQNLGVVLQRAVANLARIDGLATITLTAVCGAWDYWPRFGYTTLDYATLSTEARERLRAYPAECGGARLMRVPLDTTLATAAVPNFSTAPSSRLLGLPAKSEAAPRTRLAMRLTRVDADLLTRTIPPSYRLVPARELPLAGRTDLGTVWGAIVHAAGEQPSLDAAQEQYAREFRSWEVGVDSTDAVGAAAWRGGGLGEVGERMFFLLDGDGVPVGTATAWFEPTAEGAPRGVGPVGRVHWLSIVPAAQGRGLAKPLLGAVLSTLLELHGGGAWPQSNGNAAAYAETPAGHLSPNDERAEDGAAPFSPPPKILLKTHCQAARAIGMYLEAGFEPTPLAGCGLDNDIGIYEEAEGEGWQRLAELGLPILIPGTLLQRSPTGSVR